MHVVYFSSTSENTKRFVDKLGHPSSRIPLRAGDPSLEVDEPYILVVPSYGAGRETSAVPKQVIRFLNEERNRKHIRGVIAGGNTNFGSAYCIAGKIVASKCQVPLLYTFEVFGTPEDVASCEAIISSSDKEYSD